MAVRVSVVVGMLVLAFCASAAASLAQDTTKDFPPVVERELIVSDPSCTGSPPSPDDFTEAFATRISSSRVLRFIAFLDRLPETDQMRVVAAIDALPKVSVESQAERGCRTGRGRRDDARPLNGRQSVARSAWQAGGCCIRHVHTRGRGCNRHAPWRFRRQKSDAIVGPFDARAIRVRTDTIGRSRTRHLSMHARR